MTHRYVIPEWFYQVSMFFKRMDSVLIHNGMTRWFWVPCKPVLVCFLLGYITRNDEWLDISLCPKWRQMSVTASVSAAVSGDCFIYFITSQWPIQFVTPEWFYQESMCLLHHRFRLHLSSNVFIGEAWRNDYMFRILNPSVSLKSENICHSEPKAWLSH